MWTLLRCIGRAVLVKGGKALLNAATGGIAEDAVEIAQEAWAAYQKDRKGRQPSDEVQSLAQVPTPEAVKQANSIAAEVAAGQPEEVCRNLAGYLAQVPAGIRRSLRRPSDPSGRTVPPGLVLRKADDLLAFLPTRLSRFKEGDFPLPGVDLELVELLGVGGYGEVWKARNPYQRSDPPVALKFCLDKAAAASLRHEAALLDRVKSQGTHDGIVKLLRTYLRADPPCLEYEYVEGGDLGGLIQEWHRSQGGVPPQRAARLMLRLADIVGFAHRLKPAIVHRDLKPANILVQQQENRAVLRVADFGIGGLAVGGAAAAARTGTTRGLMAASVARGSCTPLYASPQQMAGGEADPRDDVYALGVIWYQLLTGSLASGPPTGFGWADDLRQQGVSEQEVRLMASCFEASPARRPADAGVLAERLAAHVPGGPPAVGPAEATEARPPAVATPQPPAASQPPRQAASSPRTRFPCPHCGAALAASGPSSPGRRLKCPHCGQVFSPEQPASGAAPQPPQRPPDAPKSTMRLTLRSLLAYLDEGLEPHDMERIGELLGDSDNAQELSRRMFKVIRSQGLTVPPDGGPGDRFDANTVAEYLENYLDVDQLVEFEKTCLASDVHLAEVTACHEILTLVLNEAAQVPPAARQRIYKVILPAGAGSEGRPGLFSFLKKKLFGS